MKNWIWKQWAAIGVISAVVIASIVCHLVQPEVTYAWLEMVSCGTFVLGAVVGRWLSKREEPKK